jgi:hypothetical protein
MSRFARVLAWPRVQRGAQVIGSSLQPNSLARSACPRRSAYYYQRRRGTFNGMILLERRVCTGICTNVSQVTMIEILTALKGSDNRARVPWLTHPRRGSAVVEK